MSEWRVTQIVGQGDDFGEPFVRTQSRRECPGDVGHLQRMRQARAEVVVVRRAEDLRLALESSKRRALDDAVTIDLERAPQPIRRLRM
jgi:hypothetical protein